MLLSGRVEEWSKIFIPERTSAKQYNQTIELGESGVEQDYARLAPKCRPPTGWCYALKQVSGSMRQNILKGIGGGLYPKTGLNKL